ncbi:MAG: hypothetical protein R3Y35_06885 [Clostridia bacterium]
MIKLGNKNVVPFKGDYKPISIYNGSEKIFTPTLTTKTGTELTFENTYNDECELIKIYGDSYQEQNKIAVKTGNTIQFDNHKGDYMIVKSETDCTININSTEIELSAGISSKINLISGINILESDTEIEVQYLKSDTAETEDSDLTSPTPNFPETINCVNGTLTSYKGDLSSSITIPNLYAIRDSNGNVIAQDTLYIDKEQKRMWVEQYFYEKTFTGTEGWYYASSAHNYAFGITAYSYDVNSGNLSSVYSTEYRGIHLNYRYIDKTIFINSAGIIITDSNYTSTDLWKQYLSELYNSNTPLTAICQLKTPRTVELDYENLNTFPYITNIVSNSNVIPSIEVTLKQFQE